MILMALLIGFSLGLQRNRIPGIQEAKGIKKVNRLLRYIEQSYVEPIDTDSLVGQIMEQIVDGLDPHSSYISAQEQRLIAENMQGNFVGIGVSFYMLRDTVTVVRVLKDGPSAAAGIQTGDRILIADRDTLYNKNLSSEAVIGVLKDSQASRVDLQIYRKETDSLFQLELFRGEVPLPSINAAYSIDSLTTYIKVNRFSQTTLGEFKTAVAQYIEPHTQKVLIDLRDNPGGYLDPAIGMSEIFLAQDQPIVRVKSNQGQEEWYTADSDDPLTDIGVYILVNEQSASASEIVAGAIQDNDRGWIVGQRTFGKGLVQQQMPLGGGDVVRLTTARYYTPTGRSIQRPYSKNDNENYFAELNRRWESGEQKDPENIPINDSLEYKTPQGRTVYGGGGIVPDIFVPNTNSMDQEWNDFLLRSNLVNRFVFLQLDKDPSLRKQFSKEELLQRELSSPELWVEGFRAYTQELNVPVEVENEALLRQAIRAYIALQLYGENLFIQINNLSDPYIQAALAHQTILP